MPDAPNEPRTPPSIHDIDRFDPLREPDWRFRRVLELIEHQPRAARCKAFDDESVQQMRQFMLACRARGADGRKKLFAQFPGPYYALAIHEAVNPELRLWIQCRILARQSDEDIARRNSTWAGGIEWYERMFFNVRDRLDDLDWIVRHILGPAQLRNLSNIELPLKLFAYCGGTEVLDYMLTGFRDGDQSRDRSDVDSVVTEFVISGIGRRAAMAIYTFDANKFNVLNILDLFRQIWADAKGTKASSATEQALCEAARATIQSIKFVTGDAAEKHMEQHHPELAEFDRGGVELRDDELHRVLSGDTRGLEHLKYKRFPEREPPGSDEELDMN